MSRAIDASVVIPTHNRARLLERVLQSLALQTADPSSFEVVVVDDGSSDDTSDVCRDAGRRLELAYLQIEHGGASAAKNAGIEAARGRVIVLADDDDVADRGLVAEHLRVHAANPGASTGVLGYATWDPALPRTELMHFVTDVGGFLLSYGGLSDGATLDYHYFWSGCISAPRELLRESGGFDTRLPALEDVELGYRLAAQGLQIHYTRHAVKYMQRPYDFQSFCARCERTGRGLGRLAALQPELAAEYRSLLLGSFAARLDHGELESAERRLDALGPEVAALEARVRIPPTSRLARLDPARRRLYRLYEEGFRTATLIGVLRDV